VVLVMPLTSWLPLVAVLLVQPPVAVQEVAFVALHVSVEEPPLAIVLGLAVRVTVGGGTTVTPAEALVDPPVPEHVIV
jgi:hypothetical protein